MDCWKAEFRKKANIYKMLAKLGKGLKLAYMVCMQIQDTSSVNRILTTSWYLVTSYWQGKIGTSTSCSARSLSGWSGSSCICLRFIRLRSMAFSMWLLKSKWSYLNASYFWRLGSNNVIDQFSCYCYHGQVRVQLSILGEKIDSDHNEGDQSYWG